MSSIGKIIWADLTVPNTDEVRDFYQAVTGWTVQPVEMGDYADYTMLASDGTPGGGICRRLGSNANLPPQWLIYISGKVIDGPRAMGETVRFCVIQDPAGAVAPLIEGR